MDPDFACRAFNCIRFYSFITYAVWINLANQTFRSLLPELHSFSFFYVNFQTSAFQGFFPSGIFLTDILSAVFQNC